MPIYNSPIFAIDAAEARRYAGLQKADFSQQLIDDACTGKAIRRMGCALLMRC